MHRVAIRAAVLSMAAGCAAVGGGVNDGSSLSWGAFNRGRLVNAARLPEVGDGYLVPPNWRRRGLSYGTDELVNLLVHTARRVAGENPGSVLYVADLSPRRGGRSVWHRSHQNGRDADLLFFALDTRGRPARPPAAMSEFSPEGIAGEGNDSLRFDVTRNWALVRALLEEQETPIQYVFVAESLKAILLDYAATIGESTDLVQRARAVLHQPSAALPHNDHLHVRIYCPPDDRRLGCVDRGPLRWWKKTYKRRAGHNVPAPVNWRFSPTAVNPFYRLMLEQAALHRWLGLTHPWLTGIASCGACR
ncbi:MAG: penicillin-insensitive murein endopeptidase [Pseudomonadota bacterium]